jgi:hypothetical protein
MIRRRTSHTATHCHGYARRLRRMSCRSSRLQRYRAANMVDRSPKSVCSDGALIRRSQPVALVVARADLLLRRRHIASGAGQ